MNFKAEYIPERNLIFGGHHEEKDPRLGLKYFGPFKYESEEKTLDRIKLGFIGDSSSIPKVKQILELIKREITSQEHNKWLYPHFPGMSKETNFKCTITASDVWEENISQHEIKKVVDVLDVNERIGAAVELYLDKIKNIASEDNPPDVIICTIPKPIEDYCGISERTRGAKTPKPTALEKQIEDFKKTNQTFLSQWGVIIKDEKEKKLKGYDFRNALKGKVMGVNPAVPVQLIRESTMDYILNYGGTTIKSRQDPASFAWNFSTALFYKANGKPWRLAKLKQDTCYIGISFYRDKLSFNKDIQTSMAQVFTHNGEGLVLRGTEVYVDEKSKEPHLTEMQAYDLLKDSIKRYIQKAARNPSRVVIHKSTLYTDAEKKGFNKAIDEINIPNIKRDFVTLSKKKRIRFLRKGSYPVLRGTLISLTQREHLLYTSGYTPRIRTYPGHSIPQPLYIFHEGDSEIKEISNEILGLTKLNWNTTAFATYLPITLAFSGKVGQILSELSKNSPLQNHYKFYM